MSNHHGAPWTTHKTPHTDAYKSFQQERRHFTLKVTLLDFLKQGPPAAPGLVGKGPVGFSGVQEHLWCHLAESSDKGCYSSVSQSPMTNHHYKVPQGLKPQKEGNSQLPECVIEPTARLTAQANYLGGLICYQGLSGPFCTTRGME